MSSDESEDQTAEGEHEEGGNSRAERLRSRRRSAQERADHSPDASVEDSEPAETDKPDESSELNESSETSELSETSKPSKPSEPSETDETSRQSASVKRERVGTYMYLPEDLKKELDRQFQLLKADYEFEFDDEFEKNRHFYPLVVAEGLAAIEDLEVTEIPERLESVGESE